MSKNIKKVLMILIASAFVSTAFVSNTFAAWGYHKSYTACYGGTCHHKSVNKGCANGHCGTVRRGSTWHR